jgi:hypothetical protein
MDFDPERVDLGDIAMELPAIPTVDVREDRDRVLDHAVLGLEHDHRRGIDTGKQIDTRFLTRLFGQIAVCLEIVELALEQIAPVARDIGDVRADGYLIDARNRGFRNVADSTPLRAAARSSLVSGAPSSAPASGAARISDTAIQLLFTAVSSAGTVGLEPRF